LKLLWLSLAFLSCVVGFGWLALAMDTHWQQVRGALPLAPSRARWLRLLGVAALGAALALCLHADTASMAALVWVMLLAGAALAVAFTLSWRPRSLAPLARMAGRSARRSDPSP
jgi:Protein of unknown function (DUF3325)